MPTPAQIGALRERTIAEANKYLGSSGHEVPLGSNRGPLPDRVLDNVGADKPNPWCAAFACTMAEDAGVQHGPRTASTGAIHDWGLAHGATVTMPQKGDFGLVLDPGSPTGFKHTVIITGGDGKTFSTIEGNEGDKVAVRHDRTWESMKYVNPYLLG